MAFEYKGVVYRDLEPQVRYDAEQIQVLKQADVTINENLQTVNESLQTVNESLQTINTEVNGKLTKPTNPSAESAVTMLADGTVGTKLLSEIGGDGGKVYRHDITKTVNGIKITIRFFDSKSTSLTSNEIMIKHNGNNVAFVDTISNSTYTRGGGILNAIIPIDYEYSITFMGVLYANSESSGIVAYAYMNYVSTVSSFLTDATYTVTEI